MSNTFLTRICLVSSLVLCCQAEAAKAPSPAVVPEGFQFSVYVGGSYSIGTPGPDNIVSTNSIGYEVDTHAGNSSDTAVMPGAGIAYDFLIKGNADKYIHDFSVGIDWYYSNASPTGIVNLYNDSSLNYYDYTLNTNSNWLMFNGLLNFKPISKVTPFVLAGLDVARISSSYSTTRNSQAPGYLANSGLSLPTAVNYNAGYSLGAGLKAPFLKKTQISARYLYTDFGNIVTGGNTALSNGTFVSTINTRLRIQAWLIGLTYAL